MKRLIAKKYYHVCHAFLTDANNFIKKSKEEKDKEITPTNAIKKEEEPDNFFIYLKINDLKSLEIINWIDKLKLLVHEMDSNDIVSSNVDSQIILLERYLGQILSTCCVVTLTSDDFEIPIPLDEIGMREIKEGAILKD